MLCDLFITALATRTEFGHRVWAQSWWPRGRRTVLAGAAMQAVVASVAGSGFDALRDSQRLEGARLPSAMHTAKARECEPAPHSSLAPQARRRSGTRPS